MTYIYNDGGRSLAGYKNLNTGDCVARAVSIASGLPYREVYNFLANGHKTERVMGTRTTITGTATAAHGIHVKRKWFKDYMHSLGFRWVACMGIGTGCKVHVKADELPAGRLVLSLSNHYAAFIDGVLHDTYDSSRDGTRCVYGYWILVP